MSVSKRLRFEVLRRDNHTCRYCGGAAPDVKLHVDHVVPTALGGSDDPSNLVAACADCNSGKTSTSPDTELVDDVAQDALRWSAAMKAAADIQRREVTLQLDWVNEFYEDWQEVWTDVEWDIQRGDWSYPSDRERIYPYCVVWGGRPRDAYDDYDAALAEVNRRLDLLCPPRPKDWKKTAKSWARAGLTNRDARELMVEVRDERDYIEWDHRWRYFAGCMWNTLKNQQAIARHLLDVEDRGGA